MPLENKQAHIQLSLTRKLSQKRETEEGINRNCSRGNSFHRLPGCYSSVCKWTPGGRKVIIFTHILWKDTKIDY